MLTKDETQTKERISIATLRYRMYVGACITFAHAVDVGIRENETAFAMFLERVRTRRSEWLREQTEDFVTIPPENKFLEIILNSYPISGDDAKVIDQLITEARS